jgi:hypothetical protein
MFLVPFQRLQHVLRIKKHVFPYNQPLHLCFSIISNDTKSKEALSLLQKIHQNPEMLKHYTTIYKKREHTRFNNNGEEERLVRTVTFLNGIGFSYLDAFFVVAKAPVIMDSLPKTMMKRVEWMKRIDFTDDAILTTITRYPRILTGAMDRGYEAVSQWFIKQGVCQTKIHTLIMKNPHILSCRTEEYLDPKVKFLKSCGLNEVQIIAVLQRAPITLGLSIERLQQTVDFLLSKGCTKEQVPKILTMAPNVLAFRIEKLQKTIDLLLSKGYTKEQVFKTINHSPTTLGFSVSNLEEKFDLLTEFFGKDAVISILDRCPQLLKRNAKEMRRVFRFLKEELEWDIERIASNPRVLRYNMDTFFLPRYQFLLELEKTERNKSDGIAMKKTLDKPLEKKRWTYLPDTTFHQLFPTYRDFLVTYENKYPQY